MYSLTVFKSQFDNATDKVMAFDYWDDLVAMLEELSTQPLSGKKVAPLISPAVYEEGTTRANRNVKEWGHWACVDVDDYTGGMDDLLARFAGTDTVVYSTASSTPETPKFRVVFNLDRRVQATEVRQFWYALNKSLGDLGDPQTKDASRMYYIPADYDGAHNFIYRTTGDPLSVDGLKQKHPYQETTGNSFLDKLPDEMRRQVLEHRKNSLDNTNVTWSGYQDCPFISNKMIMDYKSIAGSGWYHGLYRIMVAIAGNAIKAKYPITPQQIALLCKQLDAETGGWYDNRPLEREAQSAIEYAYANVYED